MVPTGTVLVTLLQTEALRPPQDHTDWFPYGNPKQTLSRKASLFGSGAEGGFGRVFFSFAPLALD